MLIESYNNIPHRSIKNICPNNVNEQNIGELLVHMLSKENPKIEKYEFKVWDIVRISKVKRTFSKASKETFADELKLYTIQDLNGEPVIGSFYAKELQLAEPNAKDESTH